jgi:predicted transposase/invertase (TIGR01784 family)
MDMAIQEAQAKLEKIRSDPELVHAYDLYEQTRIDYKFGIQGARREGLNEGLDKGRREGLREGLDKGRREGLDEGRREGRQEIAQNLKGSGIPAKQIALWTGLSPDEIAKL